MLARMDGALGTVCQALLKEREKIAESVKELTQKHPGVFSDVKDLFLGENSFKSISDDLLHYTWAKRAEILELRRKCFKPRESFQATRLADIPPSESFLFDEELLASF